MDVKEDAVIVRCKLMMPEIYSELRSGTPLHYQSMLRYSTREVLSRMEPPRIEVSSPRVLGNTNVREPLLRTVISGFTRVPWCISAVGDRQDREMFVSLKSETDEAISIANDRTHDIRYVIEWCD